MNSTLFCVIRHKFAIIASQYMLTFGNIALPSDFAGSRIGRSDHCLELPIGVSGLTGGPKAEIDPEIDPDVN